MKSLSATALQLIAVVFCCQAAMSQPLYDIDGMSASGEKFVYHSLDRDGAKATLTLIGPETLVPATTPEFSSLSQSLAANLATVSSPTSVTLAEVKNLPKVLEVLGKHFGAKMTEFEYFPAIIYMHHYVALRGPFQIFGPTDYGRGWFAQTGEHEAFSLWVLQPEAGRDHIHVAILENETDAKLTFEVRLDKRGRLHVYRIVREVGCVCECRAKLRPNFWAQFQKYARDLPAELRQYLEDGTVNKVIEKLSTDSKPGVGCPGN